jgi:Dolichyl-phosphate-mannose-protein mannosyltransferase
MNETPRRSSIFSLPSCSSLPSWLPLAAVAALATVLDLTKAVHIDDTAYLEIARWIIDHPLHPMAGTMNWGNTADPIWTVSQPHLMFYLMAGVMRLVPGAVELAMHVVWVAMSATTVVLFHTLARALDVRRPLLWTAFLCLGPAFIPSQNLMVDVPLLGVWLACILMLVRADAPGEGAGRRLVLAASLVGVACLIKYTSLALLPIVGLALWWRGQRRWLAVLLIPLGVLAAWSLFNWFDYGGVHLLARPVNSAKASSLGATVGLLAGRAGLWLIALGAIVPGAVAFAPSLWRSRDGARARGGRVLVGVCAAATVVTLVVGRVALGTEPVVQSALRGLFVGNGVLTAALAARGAWQGRTAPHTRLLVVWALGAASFIILLSLFIAVRHVLVALPALVLLVARGRDAEALSPRAARVAVGLTALVGVAVGLSDRGLAALYRDEAPRLAAGYCPSGTRCLTSGHWGWQWYATKAGLIGYDSERTVLRRGDRFIMPELVSQQTLRPADAARLVPLAEVEIPSTPLTFLRTMSTEKSRAQGNRSGGYYYFWTSVPWTFTTRPLDRFRIYDVR